MDRQRPQNPFVGLRPYESSDSLYYFGRGEQVKSLLRQLHQHRFVAVVGSSGSGKSSLIRAGLIPQLEAGFLVQARDQWLVARMKPGEAPLENLVGSLLDARGRNPSQPVSGNGFGRNPSQPPLIRHKYLHNFFQKLLGGLFQTVQLLLGVGFHDFQQGEEDPQTRQQSRMGKGDFMAHLSST